MREKKTNGEEEKHPAKLHSCKCAKFTQETKRNAILYERCKKRFAHIRYNLMIETIFGLVESLCNLPQSDTVEIFKYVI